MMFVLSVFVIAVCMLGCAFFSGIETGVISIRRLRLQHFVRQGLRSAGVLQHFLEDTDYLLGTTLVGTNLCMVAISVVAANAACDLIGPWGETVSTVLMAVLVLVFCEYLPKAWFHAKPLERCALFAGLLQITAVLLRPLALASTWLTRWLVPGPVVSLAKSGPSVSKEMLKVLAREGEEHGVLSPRERAMIHRVIELSARTARQIMVPLDRMSAVDSDATVAEFFDAARGTGFTRMPVHDGRTNRFVGIVNVFHMLSLQPEQRNRKVMEFARQPLFISEDMPVDDIFPKLRRSRQPMCLVTARGTEDDVIGLVTTEDILEQIVGPL